jgi:hypothetical protein
MALRLNGSSSGYVELEAPAEAGNNTIVLPTSGSLASTTQLGFRNLVINGAMQVAQRGTQVTSITNSGYRTVDRFLIPINALGTWTIDQSTDSPNGFSNSLKLTCTTADASPVAGAYAFIRHNIEAQNLQSLGYGTADAKTMTLSFWVKSNKTGSASVDSRQLDNSSKLWSATYSISSADTWEYKTLTIPEDTAGVIDNNNDTGLYIDWWLNSGSTFTGGTAASTWSTNDESRRNPSNLGVGGATSDYFAITGVQLEVGSVATPFEHRSYGDELARCQRYFQRFNGDTIAVGVVGSSTSAFFALEFIHTMRAGPSLTVNALGSIVKEGVNWYANSSITGTANGTQVTLITSQSNNNMVSTNATRLGNGADLSFSAEL